jgi:hypothetical protein
MAIAALSVPEVRRNINEGVYEPGLCQSPGGGREAGVWSGPDGAAVSIGQYWRAIKASIRRDTYYVAVKPYHKSCGFDTAPGYEQRG